MKIRTKLAITLIVLQIFGITAISSFSILFIRSYLLQDGITTLKSDTEWIAKDLILSPNEADISLLLDERLTKLKEVSGYDFKVYDIDGSLIAETKDDFRDEALSYSMRHLVLESENHRLVYNEADSSDLYSYIYLGNNPKEAQFFELSKAKEDFYAIIATIRWIIYTGMFISIGIVIVVSLFLARSISNPILKLNRAALDIADGEVKKPIELQRNDEIGTLATSLNKMADHLRKDNERLAALNLRQRQFFGDITHEVRNPLQALLTTFDMLELDLSSEKKNQVMETARAQMNRIRSLFDDLSTLSRFDEDPNYIKKEEINLGQIARNQVKVHSSSAFEKGLKLTDKISDAYCIADPMKMEQVFDNLISNAVKYTSKGGIHVEVQQNETHQIRVSVSDSGPGIADEHLPHLFERFYRTDKARSRELGGTGLGLSVVKQILDAHQADIQVTSKIDEGTTFFFEINSSLKS